MNAAQGQEATLIPALFALNLSALKKPTKRFDQLPIGLNQRSPTYSVPFRGQDGEPGVPLYKFLESWNCKISVDGLQKESEDARYCVDLHKPLGSDFDKKTKYFNILAKLEVCSSSMHGFPDTQSIFQWPGYESSGDFLCDCGTRTTRYQIGSEFARVWRNYMGVSALHSPVLRLCLLTPSLFPGMYGRCVPQNYPGKLPEPGRRRDRI